jgi:hypothetical protein
MYSTRSFIVCLVYQEGDKYVYIEMADLFSHMFCLNNVRMHRATIPVGAVSLLAVIYSNYFFGCLLRRILLTCHRSS